MFVFAAIVLGGEIWQSHTGPKSASVLCPAPLHSEDAFCRVWETLGILLCAHSHWHPKRMCTLHVLAEAVGVSNSQGFLPNTFVTLLHRRGLETKWHVRCRAVSQFINIFSINMRIIFPLGQHCTRTLEKAPTFFTSSCS
jgi:hypothetical protein